jgi:hypothetical protein
LRHRADQLVECVVAADVLAHQRDLTCGVRETCGVGGASGGIERLPRLQSTQRATDGVGMEAPVRRDRRRRAQHCFHRRRAADAAAAAALQVAAARDQRLRVRCCDCHRDRDAVDAFLDAIDDDLVGTVDDAFAQGEAEGEVGDVVWCRHHHCEWFTVVCERDRYFGRDRIIDVDADRAAAAMHGPGDGACGELGWAGAHDVFRRWCGNLARGYTSRW